MKTVLALALAFLLLLLFGCPQIFPPPANATNNTTAVSPPPEEPVGLPAPPPEPKVNQTQVGPENETPESSPEPPPEPQAALKRRVGKVNTTDIGGKNLTVTSPFDAGSPLSYTINKTGYFNTTVAADTPHLVLLKDKDNLLRAMTVSLQLDPGYLVFDARSTAKALLWRRYTDDEISNELFLAEIDDLNCWGNFYGLLQLKLPKTSLDNLSNSSYDYKDYYSKCLEEMNETGLMK
ncbi:TPA: hypothetical protein HA225_03945 [Candidatus Micrarchaeota archaeon]|nr:hypothetical protein [Candidatus Micrarchaeota archaeon]HIH30284.1 hypothetical protein [Candidatus Micrarchaeota archaeon]